MPGSREDGPVLQDPIVAQRNPFEVFLLALAAMSGILRLLGVTEDDTLDQSLDHFAVQMWAWTLTVGCITGLVGVWMPSRWIEAGLHIERFGMTLTAAGVGIYAGSVIANYGTAGLHTSAVNIAFAAACVARVVQITRRFRWRNTNRWVRTGGRPLT